jgi:putative transposase
MQLENFLNKIKNQFIDIPNQDTRANTGTRDLIVSLVFCFSRDRGNFRTLDCIRKFVQTSLGVSIARGTFWERLATKKLQKILEGLVTSMVLSFACKLSITSDLLKVLGVHAILLLDSSSSTLPKSAKEAFPAPRNNVAPAAIKLHMCFDLFRGAVNWFQLTPATTHDRKGFPPIESLRGKLIIFDLGYWDYLLLAAIIKIGGFFLTRVKSNAVIEVLSVISGVSKKDFEGYPLFDRRFPKKKSKIVEVIGQFSQNYKPLFSARVIGFWNPISKQYHWYVTNLLVPAELIYPLYRLRWQIELVFKTFKSCLRLGDLPTANPKIIHVLIYSALAANLIAHPIAYFMMLEFKHEKQITLSLQRAGIVMVCCASHFIEFMISKSSAPPKELMKTLYLLKKELYDPNWKKRETSTARMIRMAEKFA